MDRTRLTLLSLVLALALFLALNLFTSVGLRGLRTDLTEGGLYTLSDGTRSTLAKLEEPVDVTLYWTETLTSEENPLLHTYARRVRELLEEYEANADGNLRLAVVEPLAFSEEEDDALAAGLQGPPIDNAGNRLFLGMVARNAVDATETIPFFDPSREAFLEYDLTRALTRLGDQGLATVGIISSLPVAGGAPAAPGQPAAPAWAIWDFLSQTLQMRDLGAAATEIPEDVDVLMVIHPKELTEETLYAIDQFALAGGRLMAFVDPFSIFDESAAGPMGMGGDRSSNLERLFGAWGVEMTNSQVVGDSESADAAQGNDGRPVRCPIVMRLEGDSLNADDLATRGLAAVMSFGAGDLRLRDDAPLTGSPLLTTSAEGGGLVDASMLQFGFDPAQIADAFAPDGQQRTIAMRLSGEAPTAFPAGPPGLAEGEAIPEGHLAASTEPFNAIVVSDVDLLHEYLWARRRQMLGMTFIEPVNSNGTLVTNAVDNLTGSSDLISLRSRQEQRRPFTLKDELERAADERFRARYEEYNAQLEATEQRIAELQKPSPDGSLVFSEEQQAELDTLFGERDQLRKDLRKVRYDLNADIDGLGQRLQLLNVLVLPGLVLVVGLVLVLGRGARRRAA